MSLAKEEIGQAQAFENVVHAAVDAGLAQENVGQLEHVLSRRWNMFRRSLRGDPRPRVEPLRVTLKPGVRAVKAHARTNSLVTMAWIITCIATLIARVPELSGRMGQRSDGDAEEERLPFGQRLPRRQQQVEKVLATMLNDEVNMTKLCGATCCEGMAFIVIRYAHRVASCYWHY